MNIIENYLSLKEFLSDIHQRSMETVHQDVLSNPEMNSANVVEAVRKGFGVTILPATKEKDAPVRALLTFPKKEGYGWENLYIELSDDVRETARETWHTERAIEYELNAMVDYAGTRTLDLLRKNMLSPAVQKQFARAEDGEPFWEYLTFAPKAGDEELGGRFLLREVNFGEGEEFEFYLHPDIIQIPQGKITVWDGVQYVEPHPMTFRIRLAGGI